MNDKEESIYVNGRVSALKGIIRQCQDGLKSCGVVLRTKEEFSEERLDVIRVLESICGPFDEDSHLGDVISRLCDPEEIRADERLKVSGMLYGAIIGAGSVTIDGVSYNATRVLEVPGNDTIVISFCLTFDTFDALLKLNGSEEAVVEIEKPDGERRSGKGLFCVKGYSKHSEHIDCVANFTPRSV